MPHTWFRWLTPVLILGWLVATAVPSAHADDKPKKDKPDKPPAPQRSNNPPDNSNRNNQRGNDNSSRNQDSPRKTTGNDSQPRMLNNPGGNSGPQRGPNNDPGFNSRKNDSGNTQFGNPGNLPGAGNNPNALRNAQPGQPNVGGLPNTGRNSVGGTTGKITTLDPNQGAQGHAKDLKPRDATRAGDGLPHPNIDPNSNAARITNKTPNLGDNRPHDPTSADIAKDKRLLTNDKGVDLDKTPRVDPNLGKDKRLLTNDKGIDLDKTPRLDPNRKVVAAKVDKNGIAGDLKANPQLNDELNKLKVTRNHEDVDKFFAKVKTSPDFKNTHLAHVNVDHLSGNFQKNVQAGGYNQITKTNVGTNLHLGNQYNLYVHGGDVARQLNLNQTLIVNGGWKNRYVGPVYPQYTKAAYSAWYPGPAYYPAYCWTPMWSPWVSWCFWDTCLPIYDPRPWICRPIIYTPCPPIVVYEYPVFQPLPVVACGTWVDVAPAIIDTGFDLQLLAVRFVDPGHPDQDLGPRFRVWVRNNSNAAIGAPFNVTLVAANGPTLPAPNVVQAGVSVETIDPNEIVPVDIRLPAAANRMGMSPDGHRVPFSHLHVLVDSHLDVAETNEANNGAAIARGDILPVDPAAFSTDVSAASPGSMVSLAGEGFGPEPGQIIVSIDGVQQQAEVFGWYDLGVNFKVPAVQLAGAREAQVLVIRGDGAASNPVMLTLAPQFQLGEAPLPPSPTP